MATDALTKLEKSWIFYDVGNSAFTMLVSTIIPIYFKNTAAAAGVSDADSTAWWSYAMSASTVLVAILGPILGTLADALVAVFGKGIGEIGRRVVRDLIEGWR